MRGAVSTVRATCASTIARTHGSSTRQTPLSGCRRHPSAGRISGPIGVSTPRADQLPSAMGTCGSLKTRLGHVYQAGTIASARSPPPTTRMHVWRATRRRARIDSGSPAHRHRSSACRWQTGRWSRRRRFPSAREVPSFLAVSDVLGTGWFAADAANVKPGATVVGPRGRAAGMRSRTWRRSCCRRARCHIALLPGGRGSADRRSQQSRPDRDVRRVWRDGGWRRVLP